MPYVLAIDAGTTSCRTLLFDEKLQVAGLAQEEFRQYFPQPGWVEHDAEEIFETQYRTLLKVLDKTSVPLEEIVAAGITNQRETVVVWNRHSGKPIYPAIVWQDKRTESACKHLRQEHPGIRQKTGLVVDAYFSATKINWILEHVPGARDAADSGDLLCGTIDTWLIWKLTAGAVHATDHSNASRTMLYDLQATGWDPELLGLFGIPAAMMPEIRDSDGFFGNIVLGENKIPIRGVAGDQQAALYGQGCHSAGQAKNTYGTGCFLLLHIGEQAHITDNGLLTTVAWKLDGTISYALEGSVFQAGSVIQWLRDGLGLLESAEESAKMAAALSDNGGVYLVPAFTGLGAPYWDPDARGMICGLTRGTDRRHVVRAALESIAYQSADILLSMEAAAGIPLSELRTDGGATGNNWLMQFQSDIIQKPVLIAGIQESTALGAAMLATRHDNAFQQTRSAHQRVCKPVMSASDSTSLYAGWLAAVKRASS